MDGDVLIEISDAELADLRRMYEKHTDYAPHVFSFLSTCIKWKKNEPNEKYLTLYSYKGDWKSTGTFIVLMQYSCYDLFIFTLEKTCDVLYRALTETKIIDWEKRMILFAVLKEHLPTATKALQEMNLPIDHFGVTCLWSIPKEKALEFTIDCPKDVYISKLRVSDAMLINDLWPHRYEGSENYVATFIKMNGSYGVFLRETDRLVSWVLKNHLGQLGILQTVDDQKRKGYGTLITKVLAKEIAEEGHDPVGTVVEGNVASETMFAKYGCYDLFIFTLEKSCDVLYRALTETNVIDWGKRMILYAVIKEHAPTATKALRDMNVPIGHGIDSCLWSVPKEKALEFTVQCPEDVYMNRLRTSDAVLINELWPHNYEGSVNYVATHIKMNGGCGVSLRRTDRLVSWVLKNPLGQLGILQTVDDQKRKGFGTLAIKVLAKEIAEDGHNPAATVIKGNIAAEMSFANLGFKNLKPCGYIETCS